ADSRRLVISQQSLVSSHIKSGNIPTVNSQQSTVNSQPQTLPQKPL
ncbi:hypothetical protein IQ252_28970, partial [Tychonema sp. LEGE 07203]|nr:hypothetical protein [Tychonema sp. LEGE 07203]